MALMTPADLDTVTELRRTRSSGPLELLAACLEYRFGGEIALSLAEPAAVPAAPDDIAIAPAENQDGGA